MGTPTTDAVRNILRNTTNSPTGDSPLMAAGVMVLLYPRGEDYAVLLNKRTMIVEHHKGEISFPGGARDPEDRDLEHTALRETHEEMGIHPDDVEVLGRLDQVPTRSHFLITPYVGTIAPDYSFAPSAAEVAEVLEVPVSHLLGEGSHRDEMRATNDGMVHSVSYAYDGHLVWGATARVLSDFLSVLARVPDEEAPWKRT